VQLVYFLLLFSDEILFVLLDHLQFSLVLVGSVDFFTEHVERVGFDVE
jgi:hypothetical protein